MVISGLLRHLIGIAGVWALIGCYRAYSLDLVESPAETPPDLILASYLSVLFDIFAHILFNFTMADGFNVIGGKNNRNYFPCIRENERSSNYHKTDKTHLLQNLRIN